MEIDELLKEYRRFCDKQGSCCGNCQLESTCFIKNLSDKEMDRTILYIEKWSKLHPIKTRLMDLLERYPKATRDNNGTPIACAGNLGYTNECHACDCIECWNSPLED